MNTKLSKNQEICNEYLVYFKESSLANEQTATLFQEFLKRPLHFYEVTKRLITTFSISELYNASQESSIIICSEMVRSFFLCVYLSNTDTNNISSTKHRNEVHTLIQEFITEPLHYYKIFKELLTAFSCCSGFDFSADGAVITSGELIRSFFLELELSSNRSEQTTMSWERVQRIA